MIRVACLILVLLSLIVSIQEASFSWRGQDSGSPRFQVLTPTAMTGNPVFVIPATKKASQKASTSSTPGEFQPHPLPELPGKQPFVRIVSMDPGTEHSSLVQAASPGPQHV